MASRHLLFRAMYRLGFTPWDGHPLAKSLRDVIEGDQPLPIGTALDIGCGTGDNSIYLAEHGWRVLLVVAFITGGGYGVPGIDPAEVEQRFTRGWTLLSSGDEPGLDHNGKNPVRHYLFQRAT